MKEALDNKELSVNQGYHITQQVERSASWGDLHPRLRDAALLSAWTTQYPKGRHCK